MFHYSKKINFNKARIINVVNGLVDNSFTAQPTKKEMSPICFNATDPTVSHKRDQQLPKTARRKSSLAGSIRSTNKWTNGSRGKLVRDRRAMLQLHLTVP